MSDLEQKVIALKAELQESAQLGFAECRAADELKRKNADLERELLEFKFSPLSTGSSEWRWPSDRHRNSTASRNSSDPGTVTSRKQALAAQFDADVDDFLRENEQLRDKVVAAEKANRELEAKLSTEMVEIASLKSGLTPAGQLKAMQVHHIARDIHKDRRKEELQKELDAEKLQVANLESALQEKTQQASAKIKKMRGELEEERFTREVDIRRAEHARDKEIRWLQEELEASKYRVADSSHPAPDSPFRDRLSLGDQNLAAQLGPFEESGEVELLREELRMQLMNSSGSSTALEALEEANASLKAEMEEVRRLRKERELAPPGWAQKWKQMGMIERPLEEIEEKEIKEMSMRERVLLEAREEREEMIKREDEVEKRLQEIARREEQLKTSSQQDPKSQDDSKELLRSLAALRYVEAHWYP